MTGFVAQPGAAQPGHFQPGLGGLPIAPSRVGVAGWSSDYLQLGQMSQADLPPWQSTPKNARGPWTPAPTGMAVALAIYDQTASAVPIHLVEGAGSRLTTLVTGNGRLVGVLEATDMAAGPLNVNPYFTATSDPWTVTGGTLSQPETAAVKLVNYTRGVLSNVTSGTVTIPATTAGNTLLFAISFGNSGWTTAISSVALGAQTATINVDNTGYDPLQALCELPDIAGGQTTVTVTFTLASSYAVVDIYEVSGLVSTGAFDQSAKGSATPTGSPFSSGATPATSQPAEFILGIASVQGTGITGPGAPWTNQRGASWNPPDGGDYHISGYQIAGSVGKFTYSGTFVSSNGGWEASVATYKAAPGILPAMPPAGAAVVVTPDGSAPQVVVTSETFAVTPLADYTLDGWFYSNWGPFVLAALWLDSNGNPVTTSQVALTLPPAAWTEAAAVVTAPNGASRAAITVSMLSNPTAGTPLYMAAVLMTPAAPGQVTSIAEIGYDPTSGRPVSVTQLV